MVGGGGAMVAIMAAAREKRMQEVVDGFRLADATTVDRAKRMEEVGLAHYEEANELVTRGVLVPGRREGAFYVNEVAYIAQRDRRKARGALAIVAVVLVLIGIALIFVMATKQ